MLRQEFEQIIDSGNVDHDKYRGECRAFLGLQIIRKYIHGAGIEGSGHDVIYSVDIDKLLSAGITKEDAAALSDMGWMAGEECGEEYMALFV